MKRRDRVFLFLLLLLIVSSTWVFYRTHYGFLFATAESRRYTCTTRELAGLSSLTDQVVRIGSGTKVYLCEVKDRYGGVSTFGFRFAGSYLARRENCKITIHETRPDEDSTYEGYVEFHIDGYTARCDFRGGGAAQWNWK